MKPVKNPGQARGFRGRIDEDPRGGVLCHLGGPSRLERNSEGHGNGSSNPGVAARRRSQALTSSRGAR
jgi:hypothetical protein